VIFRRHPTRETLMEMASNRLPTQECKRITMHLDGCVACGQKLEEMRVSCAVFENLSEAGLAEVMWLSQQGPVAKAPSPWWQGKFSVAGGSVFASLCVAGLLISVVPQTRVQAKANALLDESIKAQPSEGATPHFRMKVGATACPREHEVTQAAMTDSLCSDASRRLRQTAWDGGSPLSAKTFQSWRAAQPHPKDRVIEESSGWKIETTSDDGAVQRATLELRSSDHRVAQLVLQFRNVAEQARFVEEDEPAGDAVAAKGLVRGAKSITTEGDDPADVLEVRAWSALREAEADSVWDANVVRNQQSVRVNVAADYENKREQILRALDGSSKQNVPLQVSADALRATPKRAFSGDGPALAEHWVTEHYPESARQTEFKSEAARLSRDVLGRALWIERMESRRSALQGCSCAESFNVLIASERIDLAKAEMRLAQALQPLAGHTALARPLTGAEARKLDLSVQELLISNGHSTEEDGMQRQLANVQKLLQISSK
jgi:hypothetical protein